MAESEGELKSLLMKVKEESENSTFRKVRSWHPVHHFMANKWGNNGNSDRLISWAPKSLQIVTVAKKLEDACTLEEKL